MHHDSDWNYVNRADQNRVPNLSRARFDYKRKDEDDMAKSTGRISYYTSKKEVVYTSLMMCENAPPEWLHVPEENIKRFQQSIRYKRADDKDAALEKFKITFQKQRLWNEVLKIEKNADAQLGRSFEFSLPKEWSRQEQIDYTTEYIQKTFVDKGMCVDWSIHDKGDGNPHVHLLVTMRPFNLDHSWGSKEVKDWDFVRDTDGNIVVDESHPDWWQDKKNPDRHGIRIPVLDENGVQKVGARNRKQWKRVLTDATGWNNPKNCELWRSEWAGMCNRHLSIDNQIDHRSYERQGKLKVPTIHEGADARKIEEKYLTGQIRKGSWKVEENQMIKKQNALLQKVIATFGKVSVVGVSQRLGSIDTSGMDDALLSITWIDETEWQEHRVPTISDIHGDYPQAKNEIMLPTWALRAMGIDDPQIGMNISLSYQLGTDYQYIY